MVTSELLDMRAVTCVMLLLVCVFASSSCEDDTGYRIIGGVRAKEKQFKFVVALRIFCKENGTHSVFVCTGSILSTRWVLTAAHCFPKPPATKAPTKLTMSPSHDCRESPPKMLDVYTCIIAGTVNRKKITDNTQVILSTYYVQQPKFDNIQFDVALVHADTPIHFDSFVERIRIGRDFPLKGEYPCLAIGFGVTNPDPNGPQNNSRLYYINLQAGNYRYCQQLAPHFTWRTHHMCAEPDKEGTATCIGDSGGPLLCNGFQVATLVGRRNRIPKVTPKICGAKGNFIFYTYTAPFEAWISNYVPDLLFFLPMTRHKRDLSSSSGVAALQFLVWVSCTASTLLL